ncbi:inactive ubiquitin carboxyl-terminal hydrolase MINDY-4B [Porphyrio hochstetteri]
MGEQEAAHTLPRAGLEEINTQIADLNKWRDIFSFRGLETGNTSPQRGQGSAGDGQTGAGEAGEAGGLRPPHPPSAVPEPLLVSADAGGRPISLDMATGLRELLLGSVFHRFGCDWTQAHFRFREPHAGLAYALEAGKGGKRAILMAVQAHIIRYLLFLRDTEHTHLERLCRISRREQGEALAAALAETLWAAGGGGRAIVCLVSTAIHIVPSGDYKADSFTERIQLFEFGEKAAAREFLFAHIDRFRGEGSHGVILFLYSLLFSRTLERVREDLGCPASPLLTCGLGQVTGMQAVLSLLLTGQASPSRLSGEQAPGPGGEAWRGLVGYLCWGRAQAEQQVCRGLQTPQVPVWLCSVCGRHSVLFSTDSLLLSNWRRERVFQLFLYSGQREQGRTARLTVGTQPAAGAGRQPAVTLWPPSPFSSLSHRYSTQSKKLEHPTLQAELAGEGESRLTVMMQTVAAEKDVHICSENRYANTHHEGLGAAFIAPEFPQDTHSHHWEEAPCEDPSSPGNRRPSLEMAIRTKWEGATVSWNGTDPFF